MIRPLEQDEFSGAAALAAAAFRDDPGLSYVLPGDAERRLRLPALFDALLRVDAEAGAEIRGAFDEGALVGVSSSLRSGAEGPSIHDWIRHLPRLAWLAPRPAAILRGLSLLRAVDELRPDGADYLHVLAVHPAVQGRGVGAALLNAAVKEARRPLYLETFAAENRAWYEARGFKLLMEVRSPARPAFWTYRRG